MEKSFSKSIRHLDHQLKEVQSERDLFEREISAYAKKNKALEQQVEILRSTHIDSDSKAVKLLNEIKNQHKQLTNLREEEYATEISVKENRLKSLQDSLTSLKYENGKLKQMEKENKVLRTTVTSLEEKLKTMLKEKVEKDTLLAETKAKMQDNKEKVAARQCVRIQVLEDQVKTLKADNNRKSQEITTVNTKLSDKQRHYEALNSKYETQADKLQIQIKNMQREIKEKSNDFNKATEQISVLELKNNSLSRKLESRVKGQEDQLQQMKVEVQKKEEQLCSVSNRLASFQKKDQSTHSKYSTQIERLEEDLSKVQKDNNIKNDKLNKAYIKIDQLESQNNSVGSQHRIQIQNFESKIAKLESKCKEKDVAIHKEAELVSTLELKAKSLSRKCDHKVQELEDQLQQMKAEVQEKEGQICSVSNKLAGCQKRDQSAYSKYSVQIENLKEDLHNIRRDNNTKDEKLDKAYIKIDKLESQNNSIESQHRRQIQNLESKIVNLESICEDKDAEIHNLSTKMSEIKSGSQTSHLKDKVRNQALEERIRKMEIKLKEKEEELCKLNAEVSCQQMDVQSKSTESKTKLKTLEEKVKSLEIKNKNKEEQLCKISSKLACAELDSDSVASDYRVRLLTLEDKSKQLQEKINQKEEQLIESETGKARAETCVQSLKENIKRMEVEKKRIADDLVELRSVENELETKTSETSSKIQNFQRENKKLKDNFCKLKNELNEASSKISSLECDLAESKCAVIQKERQLNKLKEFENQYHQENQDRNLQEDSFQQKINSLTSTNHQLKYDLQQANEAKSNLIASVEDISVKLKKEENLRNNLQERSSVVNENSQQLQNEMKNEISKQKLEIEDLHKNLKRKDEDLAHAKKIKEEFEENYQSLVKDHGVVQLLKSQVVQYKDKNQQLQSINMELVEQHETLIKEHRNMSRRLESVDGKQEEQTKKIKDLENTGQMLKESCLLLEKQTEDLELFNNQLIEAQNKITIERDEAIKKHSQLEMQLNESKRQLKTELMNLDQCSTDQITDLKIELRNEMNQAHELAEEHRNLERRYKLLELNSAALQRKLNAEKDAHERQANDFSYISADVEMLQRKLKRAERDLHIELDRYDTLERENTQLLNKIDTEKLEHAHQLIKLNCQGSQQSKLIDFLQSRVEELEPADKKKKKKKTTSYQAPLQYRELVDLLEDEKVSNVRLQEQVNKLRSELQATNTRVKKMKHGMMMNDVQSILSPGSTAAMSAIVRSPAAIHADNTVSPKTKLRSKPRMHHNIPHRLSNWLCNHSTRCSVCLAIIHFGHSAVKCGECTVVCHFKCRESVTNTCGLPGGLFQQFKDGIKSSNLSPITCVFKGNNLDQLHGRLKVFCGEDTWTPRHIRLCSTQLRIALPNTKSPTKNSDKDDVIDLKQAAYIHTDISRLELPKTATQDLTYVFKIQTGSNSSCWPARSVYFLAAGFAEKHQWVEKLEAIVSQHNKTKNISANAKIFGNEILTLLSDEKLDINCSLPVSDKNILFGCEEGLYKLAPSTTAISSFANMKRVNGVSKVFQMSLLNKSQVIAIEGAKHRLIMFNVPEDCKTTVQYIEHMEGCHIFTVGHAEGVNYLCVASASCITILRYNERMKKFCKKKEVATSAPCTCMMFTACSVIIGTNKFYEVDLTDYKVDEFVDNDRILLEPTANGSVFPVSILKIKEKEGLQEFLLCFHEFGIFVDAFGRQTRSGHISWSRMPLSFEYRDPYLIIVQFNSVEVIQLDASQTLSASDALLDHAFLGFPCARYLGPAITEGAVYLSSNEGSRMSVFCCKGNMKQKSQEKKNISIPLGNKRHYAASASMDSLSSPIPKRSSIFSDMSNTSSMKSASDALSSSCYSVESSTSRWSGPSSITGWTSSHDSVGSDSDRTMDPEKSSNSSMEGLKPESAQNNSRKLQWRTVQVTPTKPRTLKPPRSRKVLHEADRDSCQLTEV